MSILKLAKTEYNTVNKKHGVHTEKDTVSHELKN